jgi:two-component system sensor kinase FixL
MIKTISDIREITKDFTGYFNVKSQNGEYIFVNQNWLGLIKLAEQDVIGKHDTEIFNTNIYTHVLELDAQAWQKDTPIEYFFTAERDGKAAQFIGIKWVIKWGEGEQQILCTAFDLIANKQQVTNIVARVQAAIAQFQQVRFNVHSFQRQRALFEYLSQGILIVDSDNCINLINSACEHMLGYEKGELLNQDFEILIPDRFREKHKQHHTKYNSNPEARPMGIGMDLTAKKKDGTELPVEISLSPFEDTEGHFVIVFITDVTVRKAHEEEIRRAKSELEKHVIDLQQANNEIRDFAFVSSHHLQEPLRKLQTYGGILQKSLEKKMSQKEKETFAKVLEAAQVARLRINDFILFTRLNIEEMIKTPVNLGESLHEVLEELNTAIEEEHATIEIPADLPVINADPGLMKQLFYNLTSNALKFHKIGVPPEIKIVSKIITEPANPKGNFAQISFKDNGIGFDERLADKLFHLFQKMSTHTKGTGIGLAISRKICNLHGGDLIAKGKQGEGATFIATLAMR